MTRRNHACTKPLTRRDGIVGHRGDSFDDCAGGGMRILFCITDGAFDDVRAGRMLGRKVRAFGLVVV